VNLSIALTKYGKNVAPKKKEYQLEGEKARNHR
jgi:hypothetical protein